jgi:hypothetical protein
MNEFLFREIEKQYPKLDASISQLSDWNISILFNLSLVQLVIESIPHAELMISDIQTHGS